MSVYVASMPPSASSAATTCSSSLSGGSLTAAAEFVAGQPLFQSHVPPPPPVPHIAFFPYVSSKPGFNTPVTVSITYPGRQNSGSGFNGSGAGAASPAASTSGSSLNGGCYTTSSSTTTTTKNYNGASGSAFFGSGAGGYCSGMIKSTNRRHSSGSSAKSTGTTSSRMSTQSDSDSGRATGGLASSLSPHDENQIAAGGDATLSNVDPMYEFEIPNSLVGLIIGIKGKTIKELSTRTDVRMLIRAHHTPSKVETHQICQVRGKREHINKCLQMLRRRFPPARFPELNLQPVLPPALPSTILDALNAQPTWLTLPEGVSCEAAVVLSLDPGHFFVQQPTHPSFSSLAVLDHYMIRLYSQSTGIPELPQPCDTGLLCAAPVLSAWFRAVTVLYFPEEDEVLVRFVDYGGYSKIARSQLKQIRTDLMTLPFQATECYLAHVQPVDGTSQWSDEATRLFQSLVANRIVDVTVIGYNVDDKIPVVELTYLDEQGQLTRIDRVLMEEGHAKAADPSKVQKLTAIPMTRRQSKALAAANAAAATTTPVLLENGTAVPASA